MAILDQVERGIEISRKSVKEGLEQVSDIVLSNDEYCRLHRKAVELHKLIRVSPILNDDYESTCCQLQTIYEEALYRVSLANRANARSTVNPKNSTGSDK